MGGTCNDLIYIFKRSISISSLHLIGAPEKIQDFNDEKEKLLERERKKALLQALEDKWKARQKSLWP